MKPSKAAAVMVMRIIAVDTGARGLPVRLRGRRDQPGFRPRRCASAAEIGLPRARGRNGDGTGLLLVGRQP